MVLALVIVMIVVTMIASADKKIVKQKDEANKLLKVAADQANSANQEKAISFPI